MKVILLQDVPGKGKKGDVKEVANGYAQNFLIKKGMAKPATEKKVAAIRDQQAKEKRRSGKEERNFQKMAARLQGATVEITEKVNDSGKLYAALSSAKVVDAVKSHLAVTIKALQVRPKAPIKELGKHHVKIVLGKGIEAEITVVVK
ncbi:MAG: 50S ribosomal protein L9 [Candidatus Magasanikbacteria bacterium CG10_big_fil_rev_8_21_14_0_10_43_6]|uniref:Large ribosomal subunit protein bL9 n=1 Tax=Candidatus Magasanikbacteria bacterium CG10_big_fil_rev_8_21_14_0_10_43_6 TaxID=1974650 RepID=A0A2M6W152_9BACT|nr:MAG: 50S ribosomal protein L9 [Candidatus Magasanikbacteria bacterium CG10_big_fil_rev_8_21_14_0_10_43_6]